MLAVGLEMAKLYSVKPCLLAKNLADESKNVYFVPDAALPCLSCKENPFNLVPKKKLFSLMKRYRVSNKVVRRLQKFYNSDKDAIDLRGDDNLGARIMIQEIEELILNSLKKNYRDNSADFIPYFDAEMSGKIALHGCAIGPSSSGKSTAISKIIQHNFGDRVNWILSPTASSDPVWKNLQRELGKKRVKLVNTGDVNHPISLEHDIGRGNTVTFDDQDAIRRENARYCSDLCNQALFEGRHLTDKEGKGVVCFSILHDGFSKKVKSVKSTAIEASRVILFPNQQPHVAKKVMKVRLGYSAPQIKQVFDFVQPSDRWVVLYQHCPAAVITKTGVMLV